MFNSRTFCVITVITVIALGGAVGLQFMEMQEYNLLNKLYKQYIGGGAKAAPSSAVAPAAKKADEK